MSHLNLDIYKFNVDIHNFSVLLAITETQGLTPSTVSMFNKIEPWKNFILENNVSTEDLQSSFIVDFFVNLIKTILKKIKEIATNIFTFFKNLMFKQTISEKKIKLLKNKITNKVDSSNEQDIINKIIKESPKAILSYNDLTLKFDIIKQIISEINDIDIVKKSDSIFSNVYLSNMTEINTILKSNDLNALVDVTKDINQFKVVVTNTGIEKSIFFVNKDVVTIDNIQNLGYINNNLSKSCDILLNFNIEITKEYEKIIKVYDDLENIRKKLEKMVNDKNKFQNVTSVSIETMNIWLKDINCLVNFVKNIASHLNDMNDNLNHIADIIEHSI